VVAIFSKTNLVTTRKIVEILIKNKTKTKKDIHSFSLSWVWE